MDNPYMPIQKKILKTRNYGNNRLIRIECDDNPDPGQFYQLSVPGYGECPISVCSNNEKYVEFCIRNVGTVTEKLVELKKGEELLVRGPYGKGYPKDIDDKELIIIAGGTGAAPVRSLIQYGGEKAREISIFLGFRNYDEIIFKEDIKKWEKDHEVRVTLDNKDKRWKGKVGVVTELLSDVKKTKGGIAVVCGPPVMIKFVVKELMKKGFKSKDIYVSFERLMHCGMGHCGHCMIDSKYVCKDGPVFRYDIAKFLKD